MKKTLLILPAILSLTACGFQPMYGSHSQSKTLSTEAAASMQDIEIGLIPDRDGQYLRNELIDLLNNRGTPENARYQLSFTIVKVDKRELDLTKNSEATRAQIIATTGMTLTDGDTGEAVLTRPLKSISSYNILPSEFATRVTENAARESSLKDLARQAELQLSLFFNRPLAPKEDIKK